MRQAKVQKIFEKYNPADGVIRCPSGRSPIRKSLDIYAKAAVNLYGVISTKELAEIFNSQNSEQTTADEIHLLLLPLVLKGKWYGFYKDYIVHYWALEDFDLADYILQSQIDKPRYLPEKDEFIKFANQYYENNPQVNSWENLLEFFDKKFTDNLRRYPCYHELKEYISINTGIQKVGEILERNDIIFKDERDMKEFFNLLTTAKNNTRIWENKGHTPAEMCRLIEKSRPKGDNPSVAVHKPAKVGPNAPCPCGSGKKYKKCCGAIDTARTAQLSYSDCVLFYETWYGLMGFVNEKKKILKAFIKPIYPNPIADQEIYKVREALWKTPKLIDDYLKSTELPQEKEELLKAWRKYYKQDSYFLLEYLPEYAVVIGSNAQKEDRLYGVKGISQSIAQAIRRQLPVQFETVLLPFKGKIIYDGFMTLLPVSFGAGAREAFREMYDNALIHGIITSLE